MRELLDAVRRSCPPPIWSRGVELVREDAVSGESDDGEEVTLRVRVPNRPVPPTVRLYPDDEDWDCDCGSRGTCEHVAAAAIALKQARERGEALPTSENAGAHIVHELRQVGPVAQRGQAGPAIAGATTSGIELIRHIVTPDGQRRPLEGSLTGLIAKGADAPLLSPNNADFVVDQLITSIQRRGVIRTEHLPQYLTALRDVEHLEFKGQELRVRRQPVLPRAKVVDHASGEGFVLSVEASADVDELVCPGYVRCGGQICPIGEQGLSGSRLEKLPKKRRIRGSDTAKLVNEILPSLGKRISVDVLTDKLPKVSRTIVPRIALEIEQEGDCLEVLPKLVYGEPAVARIDGDHMVRLGDGPVPMRDTSREAELTRRLRDRLNLVPGKRSRFESADAPVFMRELNSWRGEVTGELAGTDLSMPELEVQLDLSRGDIDLHFRAKSGDDSGRTREAAVSAVFDAWQAGLDHVPLLGGGFAPLPHDWLAKHGHRVASLLAAREQAGHMPKAVLPELVQLCDALEQPRPPSFSGLEALVDGFKRIPEATLPSDLTAELRSYQRVGVNWLAFLRDAGLGATLADDMGLGKTLQTLCVLDGRSLVVCPTSVLPNWQAEAQRFRPDLKVCVYHGSRRQLDPNADLVLTSYALMRLDKERLGGERWRCVVLDEAQTIKNPDSKVARAAFDLDAEFKLTLSGTPVENRLEELWSQFHFAHRGLLGGLSQFRDRYAKPIAAGDEASAVRLRNKVKPFLLRRLKREVAPELPPRTDTVLYCELEAEERAVYDAIRSATKKTVLKQLAAGSGVMAALEALLRLRQAACHPSLVPGQKAASSAKLRTLCDTLERVTSAGHRALVFSQWTSMLDLIEPGLNAQNVSFSRLDGSTRDRAGVVEAFQAENGPPVMLLSLKAGGTGLNLTAADHVFIVDPWWNPAVEDQAADRAHRIGQERPVQVHRLVARDTVEERILALQVRKRAIAESAVGDGGAAAAITRDDLLALLEDHG